MELDKYLINYEDPLDDNIIKLLKKTNIGYLKDLKSLFPMKFSYITRGIKSGKGDYFIGQVRQDRRPTDSKIGWHDALNAEFVKKYGIEARSKSLFCARMSRGYGGVDSNYMVFPIGNFYILYSNEYSDLFFEMPKDPDDYEAKAKLVVSTIKKSSDWSRIAKEVEPITELMVVCKSYLMVNRKFTNAVTEWIQAEIK